MSTSDVKVYICIPSLPTRELYRERAVASVRAQFVAPFVSVEPVVAVDEHRSGAWCTRNAAIRAVPADADWIGFLDDDDELCTWHVPTLLQLAHDHDADMVWGWYDVIGGGDPFPHYRGRQYDRAQPHIVPITYMVRAELAKAALDRMGGFLADNIGAWDNQDMPIIHDYLDQGAKLQATDATTWKWYHHGRNTSGMPDRGS